MSYPQNTQGTTMDGVLAALTDLVNRGPISYLDVPFAAGASVSGPVDVTGKTVMGMSAPAAFIASSIAFLASIDGGATYQSIISEETGYAMRPNFILGVGTSWGSLGITRVQKVKLQCLRPASAQTAQNSVVTFNDPVVQTSALNVRLILLG